MVEFREFILSPEIFNDLTRFEEHLLSLVGKDLWENSHYRIERKSIDARGGKIRFNIKIGFYPKEYSFSKETAIHIQDISKSKNKVIIIGAGPAGLFSALELIQLGIKPIIIERGKDVRARRRDLASINRFNIVNSNSNYCFGEGGAGTYSDGKLYTRSKKKGDIRQVLNTFVCHGADQRILYEAHPHIGTNKLPGIIESIRNFILDCGGEVHFNEQLIELNIEGNSIRGIKTHTGKIFEAENLILATGHSARDIFKLLVHSNIRIESKPFAIGVRIEMAQNFIDQNQYKLKNRPAYLPAASFSLVSQSFYKEKKKGVFSFCMCPGGFIVPSATNQNEVVVNGMSPSRRDSKYANSGIVVTVEKEDFDEFRDYGPLEGMYYQEKIEQKAHYFAGETQKAMGQLTGDFIQNKISHELRETSYIPGLYSGDFRELLPENIYLPLADGLNEFNRKIKGFGTNLSQIIGLESRTSSPVKIPRDKESFEHPEIQGLYPCGEGAGYAGGIMSAALDGISIAQAIHVKIQRK